MAFDDLPLLDRERRIRRARPKGATRLEERIQDKRDTRRLEAAFRVSVWRRDNGCCRSCGRKVKRMLELDPMRGEVHHLARRLDKNVKYDRRNGILLCAACHQQLSLHAITIVVETAQTFELDGRTYLDADHPLEFVRR
jgi:5-methylcytosine-specific restriction endonuclease McrA